MPTFVGIDLGTTNSVVAHRNAYGKPEVIPNREGASVTPSVIYFGADPPAVGQEAKEWARLGNDEVASFFKPHMGNPLYTLRFYGNDYSATDLSAIVLSRLKEDAEARLGERVDRAVITVPAYFGDPQRKATIAAGEAAGLRVSRIINEPTAAVLAYGMHRTSGEEAVLIYDLGGGTFDVTVARITDGEISVLSTTGDHDLGGKNWDDRIATFLAEQFARDTGLDPLDDPAALNEVLIRSEQAKWILSDRTSTRVTLQIGSERRSYELTRAEFEGMTFPLMDRTRTLTEEALHEAGLTWERLHGVLLVGGSTRMPMVRNYVTKMAGAAPKTGVNVDEVVALGAAMQAAIDEERSGASPRFTLQGSRRIRDVMAHSLGTIALNAEGTGYLNDIVIRRNVPIPAENSRSYRFNTHKGRNDRLEVFLTQGESTSPLDCSVIGKYVFSDIEPTDQQVTIDVSISYDDNGVVQVNAVQRDTRTRLPMTAEPVPDDLSWIGRPPAPPETSSASEPKAIYLLIDVSASMAGHPLLEAQSAARAFLDRCDFSDTQVGLISFSSDAKLLAEATNEARRVHAAIRVLQADGSTSLTDALEMAVEKLTTLRKNRYIVILTDGFPDAPESAVDLADRARSQGIGIIAIGIGAADRDYLRRLSSTESGAIFAGKGELVGAFGRIAQVISEGGRGLRIRA